MKITLREVFLVPVIFALAIGWYLDRDSIRQQAQRQQKKTDELSDELNWQIQQFETARRKMIEKEDEYLAAILNGNPQALQLTEHLGKGSQSQ